MRITLRSKRELNGKRLKNLLRSLLNLFFVLVITISQSGRVAAQKGRGGMIIAHEPDFVEMKFAVIKFDEIVQQFVDIDFFYDFSH